VSECTALHFRGLNVMLLTTRSRRITELISRFCKLRCNVPIYVHGPWNAVECAIPFVY